MRCCRNINNTLNYPSYEIQNPGDDRFFLAPFLVGGLAGTALGYGLANNNNYNNQPILYGPFYPVQQPYPVYNSYQPYPVNSSYTNSTNYYY